jgi:hypothetical protein
MHLYGDTLESYVKRELPEPHLAAIDAHVSNCIFCAHGLAEEAVLATDWERRGFLGRLVRVERQGALETEAQDFEVRAA